MNRSVALPLICLLIAAGLVFYYFLDGSIPKESNYAFDLNEIRALGAATVNERPTEIRFEIISSPKVPCFALRPGCLGSIVMTRGSFQIVTPSQTILMETGMDFDLARAHNQHEDFSKRVWNNIQDALSSADIIIATHEHPEHIGGIVRHRDPAALAGKIVLTKEQFSALPGFAIDENLPEAFGRYQPIDLSDPFLVAPGVVMIPASGHTPGSVMFYVQMNTGRELLFIGDIAYTKENIEQGVDRPRFVRFLMVTREDRNAVVNQLRTLHNLSQSNPEITIIPAHADNLINSLIEDGVIISGFDL